MPGKITLINPLESRKRLLIAESELNRAQLVGDITALTEGVHTFTGRAKSLGSIAAAAAALVAGLAAFRRNKSAEAPAKPSWFQTVVKGTKLVSSLWMALPARNHNHDNHRPDPRT
jgi:uncharacterized membrane-anchored protein